MNRCDNSRQLLRTLRDVNNKRNNNLAEAAFTEKHQKVEVGESNDVPLTELRYDAKA